MAKDTAMYRQILEVPIGPELIGRVVDALGNPIEAKVQWTVRVLPNEKVAPGMTRRKINRQDGLESSR